MGRHLTPPSAAIKKNSGACGAPNDFTNLTRSMRIPNMCLILKLDNGKVASIANGQTHRMTQPPSTVLVYRCVYVYIYLLIKNRIENIKV